MAVGLSDCRTVHRPEPHTPPDPRTSHFAGTVGPAVRRAPFAPFRPHTLAHTERSGAPAKPARAQRTKGARPRTDQGKPARRRRDRAQPPEARAEQRAQRAGLRDLTAPLRRMSSRPMARDAEGILPHVISGRSPERWRAAPPSGGAQRFVPPAGGIVAGTATSIGREPWCGFPCRFARTHKPRSGSHAASSSPCPAAARATYGATNFTNPRRKRRTVQYPRCCSRCSSSASTSARVSTLCGAP